MDDEVHEKISSLLLESRIKTRVLRCSLSSRGINVIIKDRSPTYPGSRHDFCIADSPSLRSRIDCARGVGKPQLRELSIL
jgi:hypothetical protein